MKPRLRSADITQEDWNVWQRARAPVRLDSDLGLLQYIDFCEASDSVDAELMLSHTIAYQDIVNQGYPQYRVWHAAYAFVGIPIPADYCVYD